MRKLLITLLLFTAPMPVAWSICNLPPPAEDPGDPPPPPGPPPTPLPLPDEDTPADPPEPDPTPGPTTPTRPNPRGGKRAGPRSGGVSYAASWRIWWELNREHMLGLRRTIASKDVISGGSRAAVTRENAAIRERVVAALRRTADISIDTGVRAAALRALGRAGNEEDVERFLRVLRKKDQPTKVYESAAIGLGSLARVESPALRDKVRKFYDRLLTDKVWMSSHTRRLAILAVSMRGRDDRVIGHQLAVRCAAKSKSADAATLLYACGLTRDPKLIPILIEAVTRGKFNGRKLSDVARGRAALGLAMTADPDTVPVLARLLTSRSVHAHTRRSAAIGLGLMMRSDELSDAQRLRGRKALLRAFDRDRDRLVQGYAAIGMGTAFTPIGISLLRKAVDGADMVVRPYAALALGIASRRDPDNEALRKFLLGKLKRSKETERTAALSIAVGLSGAEDARDHLFQCLRRKRLTVGVRAPAIQGLGLLRHPTPEIEQTLVQALDDGSNTVVEDASLALGFLGRRTTAKLLVDKLVKTKSVSVQVHMVAALSHLGSNAAVDPLLEVLSSKRHKHTMKESAASALGILVDDRKIDPLFEIDAYTNAYGLTAPGRNLVLTY